MTKNKFALILIIIIAFSLRFPGLGSSLHSLDWDENSNAYNAYSILKTGRDEYGNLFPLANRSFEDYKPPLYMYLNVPTVAIFGLTPLAARLPSAVFGFLTIPVIYYLSKKLLESQKIVNGENFALLSAFLLAISPWHIQFSRAGFEATIGLFFAFAAVASVFYSFKKPLALILSAILFAISMYSYHSTRIYLPLLVILQIILYRKEVKSIPKKIVLSSVLVAILLIAPLFVFNPPQALTQRFKTLTETLRVEEAQKAIDFMEQDKQDGIPFSNIIHNRRLFTAQNIIDFYLWHFDLNFLFLKGDDNFRHHIENMGMLYLWQLPFVVYGTYIAVAKRSKGTIFILASLLLVPISASASHPSPHALRSLGMVVPLVQVTALAILHILTSKKRFKTPLLITFTLVILWSAISYLHSFFVHYPLEKASFWQYGYAQAAIITDSLKNDYEKVRVDGRIEQAYIFWLFTNKYDPSLFQKSGSRYGFDKFIFDSGAPQERNELYVTVPENFPPDFTTISTIYYPDGREALKIGHPGK